MSLYNQFNSKLRLAAYIPRNKLRGLTRQFVTIAKHGIHPNQLLAAQAGCVRLAFGDCCPASIQRTSNNVLTSFTTTSAGATSELNWLKAGGLLDRQTWPHPHLKSTFYHHDGLPIHGGRLFMKCGARLTFSLLIW